MDANIKNLRDALEWLDRSIREEAELDGEMTNDHAIQLGFIQSMLEKFPPRNCDVFPTWEKAAEAWGKSPEWSECPDAGWAWLFDPAKKEGGDHAEAR